MKFKFFPQYDTIDCAASCLRMISNFYGKNIPLEYIKEKSYLSLNGISVANVISTAEQIGLDAVPLQITPKYLKDEIPLPCILLWNQEHYVVLIDIKKKGGRSSEIIYKIADPASGIYSLEADMAHSCWLGEGIDKGTVIAMEPNESFNSLNIYQKGRREKYRHFLTYFRKYKYYFLHIFLGLLVSTLISLIFPFLTQQIVDNGINKNDLGFISFILLSQMFLFLGQIGISLFRNKILIHLNARIGITIVSDFLKKIMKLPISFFDTKSMGDFSQRINDEQKIEYLLSSSSLSSLFSIINIIVFSAILFYYNALVFAIFIVGTAITISWIVFFLKKRKLIDYRKFLMARENQDSLYEIIKGMNEIKLYNCENTKRSNWENIQAKLFKIRLAGLALEQFQGMGSYTITHFKNILISFFCAKLVLSGDITLGMMLSISYIIGELNSPLEQMVFFFKGIQDAKLSVERLEEVHNIADEVEKTDRREFKISDLNLKNLKFQYEGPNSPMVLDGINVIIPQGKITAIVGSSGSGKTTLLKLLLKFYKPVNGKITVGDIDLDIIAADAWRNQCSAVMQDGYIFSDTIIGNITLNDNQVDIERFNKAIRIANIHEHIESLPLKHKTKITQEAGNLSTGQRQRILIARAVYKDPEYLFFDEATSALDANNESIIMKNLNEFFIGKTVVVIAHRLSTVKNADQIIVIDKGKIAEIGNHETLIEKKGYYFTLIKNQLELGE